MAQERPAISVVIPAYNAAATLAACLRALARQTVARAHYEVIVVDDGSTDSTAAVAAAGGATVLRQAQAGPAAARNRGAQAAAGEILLFTDADCVPAPSWIEQMVAPLADPAVAGVKGVYRTHQKGLLPRFVQAEFADRYARLARQRSIDFVDTYAAAYRRTVFLAHGGFDPTFPAHSAEDVELSFRLARRGLRLVFAPDAVVYHHHPTSLAAYLWRKYRYGVWRVRVYRRHTAKLVHDSYTPRWLPLQILLAGLTWPLLLLATARPLRFAAFLPLLAFGLTTLPFAWRAGQRDRRLGLAAPALLFLRSSAQAAGLLVGLATLLAGALHSRRRSEPAATPGPRSRCSR